MINEADLENVYKKRRIKSPSMEDDVLINGYPDKNQYGFKETRKFIHLESNDVENDIKYSKVCGMVKIKAPQSVIHKKRSLLQFNNTNLECRVFLLNNTDWINGLMNFSRLKFRRITKNDRSKENTDYVPGWLARSKHLKRSKEKVDEDKFTKRWKFKKKFAVEKFERRWKFKKLRKSDMKNKFKMKDLLCMANDTLNPTSSEGINERFSTAT
jgi:hypothetical protein